MNTIELQLFQTLEHETVNNYLNDIENAQSNTEIELVSLINTLEGLELFIETQNEKELMEIKSERAQNLKVVLHQKIKEFNEVTDATIKESTSVQTSRLNREGPTQENDAVQADAITQPKINIKPQYLDTTRGNILNQLEENTDP